MEDKDAVVAKETIKELFQYGIYKLDNNLCTPEELRSLERMAENNLELYGTISDFAKFYDVPEGNIRSTINRKLLAQPVRKVFYPFHKFRKIIPDSWRKRRLGKVDQEEEKG